MTDKMVEYKSEGRIVPYNANFSPVLETVDKERIVCTWSGNTTNDRYYGDGGCYYTLNFTWHFDWTKLKNQGVESLTGYLIVKPSPTQPNSFAMQKIDINWKGAKEKITRNLPSMYQELVARFEYHLTAHYAETPESKKVSYDEVFAASDLNDVILIVEGKNLHVNKAFLSIHSEFFRALFSSNFKEGRLTEIPIQDVSYADFALLLSTIYPQQVFPNDMTAEKLLELADRFLMPAVTNVVAHHLIHMSKLSNEKILWMADAYGMPELLEKCIRSIDHVDQVKIIERSPKYAKLSLQANQMLFRRLLQLV